MEECGQGVAWHVFLSDCRGQGVVWHVAYAPQGVVGWGGGTTQWES